MEFEFNEINYLVKKINKCFDSDCCEFSYYTYDRDNIFFIDIFIVIEDVNDSNNYFTIRVKKDYDSMEKLKDDVNNFENSVIDLLFKSIVFSKKTTRNLNECPRIVSFADFMDKYKRNRLCLKSI